MAMKLHRTIASYRDCIPGAVASGSFGQMTNFAIDAQADIATLADLNADLLAMLKHAVHWHDQISATDVARYQAAIDKAEAV